MNDLISVIIPVYNSEKSLLKCVESVQNQTYKNLDIILIDDGSFDGSSELCDTISQKDKRIQTVHVKNGGAGQARNMGINMSRGQYIVFVDSDDYIEADMIFELCQRIELDGSDACTSDLSEKTLSESFCTSFLDSDLDKIFFVLSNNLMYGPCQKIYRASIIKKYNVIFPTDLNYGEDMVFNIRHMRHIDTISYVNKNFYHYIRDNQESLSQKVRWNMFDNDMIFEKQLRDLLIEKNIFEGKIKEYDAFRILGVAYDSLFLLTRKDCPFKHSEIKQYINNIIQNDLVQWSLSFVDTDKYVSWMIDPMKRKQAWKIRMLCYIKRKL